VLGWASNSYPASAFHAAPSRPLQALDFALQRAPGFMSPLWMIGADYYAKFEVEWLDEAGNVRPEVRAKLGWRADANWDTYLSLQLGHYDCVRSQRTPDPSHFAFQHSAKLYFFFHST
jgi:hypothetical protein